MPVLLKRLKNSQLTTIVEMYLNEIQTYLLVANKAIILLPEGEAAV